MLNANVLPKTNWETDGNQIVAKIFSLNNQARLNPSDFNVWTESLVPWTYDKNDDFLKALLKNSSISNTKTILGMNTSYNANTVFNSAYVIEPDKNVIGRYDKIYPLTFMEAPLSNSLAIMFANSGFSVKPGLQNTLIDTDKGKIGIYICNEATIAKTATNLTKAGAGFLVNISNDGWFKDTYITTQHFYYNRLRAVENRRDVVVNSNCGYSGKTTANGEIEKFDKSVFPAIHQVIIYRNQSSTLYTNYPNAFIAFISLLFLTLILFKQS